MTRTNGHIRVRHPQIFLPLSTLACAHRHVLILPMIAVESIGIGPRRKWDFHHGLLGFVRITRELLRGRGAAHPDRKIAPFP
jgi:hypothetical protein